MGGGSGGSGKVEYAAYLQDRHSDFIGLAATYSIDLNLTEVLNTMMAASPYVLATAFNPDADIAAMLTAVNTYDSEVDSLLNESDITSEVTAYAAVLDDELDNNVTPQYNAMMRDICAVQTSSFAVGLANIATNRQRDIAKFTADLRFKRRELYIQGKRDTMHYTLETKRAAIQSGHDQEQRDSELDALDIGWDMECLLRGGQLLGALGGGTHVQKGPSKAQSAVAGALTGAAAGAYVGSVVPGVGTAIGAGVGGALGAAAAFM